MRVGTSVASNIPNLQAGRLSLRSIMMTTATPPSGGLLPYEIPMPKVRRLTTYGRDGVCVLGFVARRKMRKS